MVAVAVAAVAVAAVDTCCTLSIGLSFETCKLLWWLFSWEEGRFLVCWCCLLVVVVVVVVAMAASLGAVDDDDDNDDDTMTGGALWSIVTGKLLLAVTRKGSSVMARPSKWCNRPTAVTAMHMLAKSKIVSFKRAVLVSRALTGG